jgi:hypothetical protein
MIRKIRQLLDARPFRPFIIHTSGGKEYRVPTTDHISFNPKGTDVVVYFDQGGLVAISPLHITSLAVEEATPA